MSEYSQEAFDLQLALEAGLVGRERVISWADRILEQYDYDDAVAEVALAVGETRQELARLLSRAAERPDEWLGLRRLLGEMSKRLRENPARARGFAAYLDNFCALRSYEIPSEEFHFLIGIEDRFSLAEQGLHETIEQATQALMDELSHFADDA